MALKLFYSYTHEDNSLRLLLEKHLANLRRSNLITGWHDRNISAGKEWAKEVHEHLNTADIILLLISSDFVSSDYCYSVEMKRALERHENGSARVVPIILRPGDYEGTPFSKLLALPTDSIPVRDRKWRTTDEAFRDIAQGIRKVANELVGNRWLYEADIYFYREEYQKALEAYEIAINFEPNNAPAYVGQGNVRLEFADRASSNVDHDLYKKALESFEKAINIDQSVQEAYIGKGKALLGIAHHENSGVTLLDILNAYNKALALTPINADIYLAQAEANAAYKDREEETLKAYRKYVEAAIIPQAGTYRAMGDIFFALELYEQALDTCEKALEETPENAGLYKGKGDALLRLKRYKEALAAYDKALSLGCEEDEIHFNKGEALYELKQYQLALKAYEISIMMYERTEESYKRKSDIYQALAKEAIEKATSSDDFDPWLDPDDLP